jgi:hypothetical protein
MADVITLKDGSVEIIFELKDFQELIDQELGHEAAKYFQLLVENYETRIEEAEEGTNSDLRSYEMSLESNMRAFQDIEEICRTMISEFNREEGRNKLNALRPWHKRISKIIDIINNQI